MRLFAALLLLAATVVPTAGLAQSIPETPPAELHPGDRFDLNVWRNVELTGTFEVAQDSGVFHPIFRNVKVAGVPFQVAEERLREFLLTRESNPQFVFQPRMRVYVGGQVRGQNQYFLPEVSVAEAITEAGGSTAPNDRLRVRVVRNGVETVASLAEGEATALLQLPIRSGDQIVVEERPSFMRNYVQPALGVVQTITGFVATYVFLKTAFN